ncbi:MAG: hypothetical protein ACK4E4_06785 [Rhodocyclaceae bacterium]
MDADDRAIISVVAAVCMLLALAGAVWLPWWALPFFGASLVWGAPLLAALMSRRGPRP